MTDASNSRLLVARHVFGRPPTLAELVQPLIDAWNNRSLIITLVLAAEKSQYHRVALGMAWKYIEPICFVLTYYIFMRAVRGASGGSTPELLAVILSGMMMYEIFRRSFVMSCMLFINSQSLLTTTSTPLIVVIGTGLLQTMVVNYPVWLFAVLMAWYAHGPSIGTLFLPLLLAFTFFCVAPLTILFAFCGTYFRDLGRTLDVFMRALLFVSPVLYDTTIVTGALKTFLLANPLTPFIETSRDLLWRSGLPHASYLAVMGIIALGLWPFALWVMHRIGRRVVKVL